PLEREPHLVRRAVSEGLISRARAEAVYGVLVDGGGEFDLPGTHALRTGEARGRTALVHRPAVTEL
ncbi:MAG: hydantoinase B/oxoprolinase family protein, partial [Geminicoccaceae bacterium]